MDPQGFLAGRSRETGLRRDAHGQWFDGEEPITHPGILKAFDRWIDRAEDGRYCLRNDVNWAYVSIEGAPIFVRSVEPSPGTPLLSLSDGNEERLAPATLRQGGDGALYCQVRRGTLAARFDRAAAVQLAELGGEDEEGAYLEIGGVRYRPPVVADPLR